MTRNHQFFNTFDLDMCFAPQRCYFFGIWTTSGRPWMARTCGNFQPFDSKCVSRPNGLHFFNISTAKSGPDLVCFLHVDFQMCLAPRRRALFQHPNFQKWSENGVFCTCTLPNVLRATTACTFSTSQLPKVLRDRPTCFATFLLQNVFRATTACTFSTSQLPKVVRAWCALPLFNFKYALRHNGMQFVHQLAPHPPLKRAYFSTLQSQRLSYLFAQLHLLSSDFLHLWSSPSLIFSLLTFSMAELLPGCAFPSVHIVGNLASKRPSTL